MKKSIYAAMLCILLATNILSITNAKFYDLLANAMTHIPISNLMRDSKSAQAKLIKQENKKLKTENVKVKKHQARIKANAKKARAISSRAKSRIAKNITANTAALVPSSVPIIGIAANVAMTSSDVITGCQTMNELDALESLLTLDEPVSEIDKLCGIELPSTEQVTKEALVMLKEYSSRTGQSFDETIDKLMKYLFSDN